jgi:uncharacterized protein
VAWLLRDGEVLASLEVAGSLRERTRGLLGRSGLDGAFLLRPCRSVHTLGMRFPIEVAYCDNELTVLATDRLRPWRLAWPASGTRAVIEAEVGAFDRWGLRPGDRLEVQ